MDRLTRRVSVFEGPDCEKCIVLSREIGVVKYAALEFSRAKKDRAKILAGESGRGGGGGKIACSISTRGTRYRQLVIDRTVHAR